MPEVISGNIYNKYESRNPIVRILMNGFFRDFETALTGLPVKTILEVGCGEGEIGKRLTRLFPLASYLGTDISPEIIQEARGRFPGLQFETVSVYDLGKSVFKPDLIIASEVFEHLEKPILGMNSLLDLRFKYLLISVPREPVWRILNLIRGKYFSGFGNTPGHVNHWSKTGFMNFMLTFKSNLDVQQVLNPFPWTMVLCKKR